MTDVSNGTQTLSASTNRRIASLFGSWFSPASLIWLDDGSIYDLLDRQDLTGEIRLLQKFTCFSIVLCQSRQAL